jgi:hypothetical protein
VARDRQVDGDRVLPIETSAHALLSDGGHSNGEMVTANVARDQIGGPKYTRREEALCPRERDLAASWQTMVLKDTVAQAEAVGVGNSELGFGH